MNSQLLIVLIIVGILGIGSVGALLYMIDEVVKMHKKDKKRIVELERENAKLHLSVKALRELM